jgi:hypothetical protein
MHISKMEMDFFDGKNQMNQIVIVTSSISKYNRGVTIVVPGASQV